MAPTLHSRSAAKVKKPSIGDMKTGRSTSCERCKRRKQKCDHRLPSCTNCLKAEVPCVQPEKYYLQVPQKDPYTVLLEEKVFELEQKVKQLDSWCATNGLIWNNMSLSASTNSSILSPQTRVKSESEDVHSELSSASGTLGSLPIGEEAVLGADREKGDKAPQSFSVVSSLLNDTFAFTGEDDADDDEYQVRQSIGGPKATTGVVQLIPGYNFEGFLKYRPAFNLDPAVADDLFEQCLQNRGGRSAYIDRKKLKKIHDARLERPKDPEDPEYNFNMFVLYMSYALVKTMETPDLYQRSCQQPPPSTRSDLPYLRESEAGEQEVGEPETANGHWHTASAEAGVGQTSNCLGKETPIHGGAGGAGGSGSRCEGKHRGRRSVTCLNLYSAALRFAQHVPATPHNKIWQILALVVCSFLQMRSRYEHDNGTHSDMVRTAIKLCTELNLHKEEEISKYTLYEQEMRKRLFWASYNVERIYCLSTGRKFSLDDREITVSFPANIEDDDLYVPNNIIAARARDAAMPNPGTAPYTSMSFLIGIWRLRRLESSIVQDIYFSENTIEEKFLLVLPYYDSLQAWQESVAEITNDKQKNIVNISHAAAVRILLQPFISRLPPESDFFQICVKETGRLCSVFSSSLRAKPEMFSIIAVNTNFVAGLTLIYCLWLSKDSDIMLNTILEHLRVCSSALYAISERSSSAIPYREKFEKLVSATVAHILDLKRSKGALTNREVQKEVSNGPNQNSETFSQAPESSNYSPHSSSRPFVSSADDRRAARGGYNNNGGFGGAGISHSINRGGGETRMHEGNTMPTEKQHIEVDPQAQHVQGQQQPFLMSGPMGFDLNPWVATESYGYDDSIFNMIQDISVWTKHANCSQDAAELLSDHAMDFSFS